MKQLAILKPIPKYKSKQFSITIAHLKSWCGVIEYFLSINHTVACKIQMIVLEIGRTYRVGRCPTTYSQSCYGFQMFDKIQFFSYQVCTYFQSRVTSLRTMCLHDLLKSKVSTHYEFRSLYNQVARKLMLVDGFPAFHGGEFGCANQTELLAGDLQKL